MYMMNIWIGTAMSYSGKQVFSLMLFHLFFIAAPGQNQDKCSNLMWSLDKLRIREDKDLLQKFGLVHSKHLCTFYVLGSHCFKKVPSHREKHKMIPSDGPFGAFGLLGEHAGH